jgi:hypothetical protein
VRAPVEEALIRPQSVGRADEENPHEREPSTGWLTSREQSGCVGKPLTHVARLSAMGQPVAKEAATPHPREISSLTPLVRLFWCVGIDGANCMASSICWILPKRRVRVSECGSPQAQRLGLCHWRLANRFGT